MHILYDSQSPVHKTPFGCLTPGQSCTLRVHIPCHCQTKALHLILQLEQTGEIITVPMEWFAQKNQYDYYRGAFSLEKCGLYFYWFEVFPAGEPFRLFRVQYNQVNINGGEKWQLTCYPAELRPAEHYQGAVIYQIFPDRFSQSGDCDLSEKLTPFCLHEDKADTPIYQPDEQGVVQNNDFYGGNLRGILKKLPYLKSLGVTVLYLNPIFMAYSNHRYDTANYHRIDPMLGTEEDFIALCDEAHACGIRVILDGVFSHTGWDSLYFDRWNRWGKGLYHHADSPYRNWYQADPSQPSRYTSWWGIETLPCTNELDPDFLSYIIEDEDSVVAHWLRCGADGFRLDVADELPDEFIAKLYRRIKQIKPDATLYGEVWEDASNKISYGIRRTYFARCELESTMNYPFKDAIIAFLRQEQDAVQLAHTVMSIAENYPPTVLNCLMNSLSTHDTMRILTVLGVSDIPYQKEDRANYRMSKEQYVRAVRRVKTAIFLQFTLPGAPCIYYGDEVGMEGFEDPFNRRFFPWENKDENLLAFYRQMSQLRQKHIALQKGDITVSMAERDTFIFRRSTEEESLMVMVQRSGSFSCTRLEPPLYLQGGTYQNQTLTLQENGFALWNA